MLGFIQKTWTKCLIRSDHQAIGRSQKGASGHGRATRILQLIIFWQVNGHKGNQAVQAVPKKEGTDPPPTEGGAWKGWWYVGEWMIYHLAAG